MSAAPHLSRTSPPYILAGGELTAATACRLSSAARLPLFVANKRPLCADIYIRNLALSSVGAPVCIKRCAPGGRLPTNPYVRPLGAGAVLGAGRGPTEHPADVALPPCSSLSGRVCRQLNSGPPQDRLLSRRSASASPESFPRLSCLRAPPSATGVFSILQAQDTG